MLIEAFHCSKMDRLSRILEIPRPYAVGLMEMFWKHVARERPGGGLTGVDEFDVAAWCDWPGQPAALLSALAAARWIDPCVRCGWICHDWPEHCERTVHKTLISRRQWFDCGVAPQFRREEFNSGERSEIEAFYARNVPPWLRHGETVIRHGGERVGHGERGSGHGPPWDPTEPNPTIPSQTIPPSSEQYGSAETVGAGGDVPRRRAGPEKVAGFATAGEVLAGVQVEGFVREAMAAHSRFASPPDSEIVRKLVRQAQGRGVEWWVEFFAYLKRSGQQPSKTYGWYEAVLRRALQRQEGAA